MYQKAAHVKLIEKGTDDNVYLSNNLATAWCME